jgi:hypothetical protein
LPRPTKVSEGGFLVCIHRALPGRVVTFDIGHSTFGVRYSIPAHFLSPYETKKNPSIIDEFFLYQ